MTGRERDILGIIENNPFVSQNEIAARLGLSRSAVSVYLNSMYKKGVIRGRGYIIREETYPLLIGPSHIDIRSICNPIPINGVHTSINTRVIYGGPVKNTAEYLLGLGVFPRVIFAVASDSFGASFLASCRDAGIETEGSVIVRGSASPVYIETVDTRRRFISASFTTSNLSTHITAKHLDRQPKVLRNASTIVVHDSLPIESMEYLRRFKSKAKIILVSSEIQYTYALREVLDIFDVITFSHSLAYKLVHGVDVEPSGTEPPDICCLAEDLLGLGVSAFYLLLSATDFCYGADDRLVLHSSKSAVGPSEALHRIYLDCRDLMSAMVAYGAENCLEPGEILNLMAAARNLRFDSDIGFAQRLSISQLQEEIKNLEEQTILYDLSQ